MNRTETIDSGPQWFAARSYSLCLGLCLVCVCMFGFSALAQPASSGREPEELSRILRQVKKNNIFNTRRISRPSTPVARPRVPQIDAFAYVGSITSDRGTWVFFDGTGSNYKGAFHPGDKVAGFEIRDVADDKVTLYRAGNNQTFELALKRKLCREDRGPWHVEEYSGSSLGSRSGNRQNGLSARRGRNIRAARTNRPASLSAQESAVEDFELMEPEAFPEDMVVDQELQKAELDPGDRQLLKLEKMNSETKAAKKWMKKSGGDGG